MTVTSALTRLYDKKPPLEAPKNKANSQKGQKTTQTKSAQRFTKINAMPQP